MCLFLALVAGTISSTAFAGKDLSTGQIRELVKQGKILSLETILQKYPRGMQGRLLDLEVEEEHGQIVYELEFLREDGYVVEVEIDAATGRVLDEEVDR
jgi:uncharacterized membrane protein YkoI